MGTETREGFTVITAEVPLANMFGYSTDLRSATQGKGTFSMEFAKYARVPGSIQEEIVAKQKLLDQEKKIVPLIFMKWAPTKSGSRLRMRARLCARGRQGD